MRTEDGSIIQECLNGESEAFGVLVDKYKAGIYAFACAKLGDFRDAQDVTQEVFIKAYRDLRSLRRWESFAFWLYRIAYTRCAQWIRSKSKRIDKDFIEDRDPKILELPALESYRENRVNEFVRDALDSLPEIYREALMLRYFGGMNSSEIAKVLGTSPTAVRKRLSRAHAQMRKEMVAMMGTVFEGQKLQASFTFRVVDAIKRIKIHTMPRMVGLPWGLSLAVGIIITVLSFNPHISTTSDMVIPVGSPLPTESKMLKAGDIPVDILKASKISIIASKQGDDDGGKPQRESQKALILAPQAEEGTWTKRADIPVPRTGMGVGVLDGKIYSIGGMAIVEKDGEIWYQYAEDVEEYNPELNVWTKKAKMTITTDSCGIGVVNGRIYVIGGRDEDGIVSSVEEYDPKTGKWTEKADMPTKRGSFGTCMVNGKIYTIGGGTWEQPFLNFSTVEEYDPVTDRWTRKADMPTARLDLSACAANGKIYAIGGMTHWENLGNAIVEEYNPATDTWTEKASMPNSRRGFATVSVNGKIYVIGGISDQEPWPPLPNVEEYDPTTDTWTRKVDMPTPRKYLGAGAVNGRIYAIGGSDSEGLLSVVEEYNTGYSVKTKSNLPTQWGEIKSH